MDIEVLFTKELIQLLQAKESDIHAVTTGVTSCLVTRALTQLIFLEQSSIIDGLTG